MNRKETTAADFMNSQVVAASRGMKAHTLARNLLRERCSGWPVVEGEGKVVVVVRKFDEWALLYFIN